jgi:serine/threonine protein kinase
MVREDGLVSEIIEGYHITSELGSTAFSPAFLGEPISPTASYQRVIIKLLYTTHTYTNQEQQDMLQKIAALQQLQHPHILPILSVGMHKDRHYIITEYLASGSLYDRLQQLADGQPIPLKESFLIIAQVGQALQYAHQHMVVHGHLKPQNVVFNIRNEALITDFHRHALQLPDEANTASFDASLYQAPEQLTGYTSEKSDQYALASLAYTLLTGHKAFMVPSIHTPGVYYKTKALIAPGRLNAALPPHIEEAILKAMSRDPDQRFADIATFLAALRLPPAANNRDMHETLVTLAEIMLQKDDTNLPVTPVAKSNIRAALKMQMSTEATLSQNKELTTPPPNALPTLPDFAQPIDPLTFPDFASSSHKANPLTFPDAFFPDSFAATLDEADQATLKIPQPYGVGVRNNSHLRRVAKRLKSKPQQTIAILICLLTVIIVFATTSINLNSMKTAKLLGTTPSAQGTSPANSSTPTSALSPIVKKHTTPTAPAIKVPPQNATPHPTATTAPIATTLPTKIPTVAPTVAPKQVQLQVPLTSLFNNNAFGNAPGQANFDGNNFSYPSSQFPASGQITIQGVPYQFSNNGSGSNDNIVAFGQSISLPTGNYQQAFLLIASSWGPITSNVTIRYTNGSTSNQNVTVPDWYHGTGVLNSTYRYTSINIQDHPVAIYVLSITLDSTRAIQSLLFPQFQSGPYQAGRVHIFALTLLS